MTELSFKERVNKIQTELNAPKNLYNSFGKYSYRSAEGILEGVKPLLEKYKVILIISDDIEVVGDTGEYRYYIVSEATLHDTLSDEKISCSARAREELTKKGMDTAQITGSTSSYARKYALNGLLCIDDNQDPDATNDHGKSVTPEPKKPPTGDLKKILSEIDKVARGLAKTKEKEMTEAIVKEIHTLDYHTITDTSVASKLLEILQKI